MTAVQIALSALAGLALFSIALYLWMLAPARPDRAARASLAGRKYAHRGIYDNSGDAPENSMRAFAAAVDKGCGIELDVRLSKDGQVVVFHDAGLSRMCGVDAAVASLPLAALAASRLLGTAERIPSFGDFLSMVAGRAPLLVEFKTDLKGAAEAELLCSKAMELLDAYRGPYVIESFDPRVLEWFRKNRPGVMRGQLAMGLRCYVPALGKRGAEAIPAWRRRMLTGLLYNFRGRPHFISYRFEDAGLAVELCRALGAMVSVWTVKTREDGERLQAKYDAIIFEGFLP